MTTIVRSHTGRRRLRRRGVRRRVGGRGNIGIRRFHWVTAPAGR